MATSFSKKMIVIAAPSGAGKTSIVRGLLSKHEFLDFSISATTRTKRDHEINGKDYHFYSQELFKDKIEKGAFLEFEEVYKGAFYGTLYSEMDRIWDAKKYIIFDVDVEGALSIKNKYGDDSLNIFIKPPSLLTLYQRLKNRKTETPKSLEKRIKKAERELDYQKHFDEVVINDDLDIAIEEASQIVLHFLKLQET